MPEQAPAYLDAQGSPVPAADAYKAMATQAATAAGLDPDFVSRLIGAESNWNPKAVSTNGAQGLMQLMPSTARQYGVTNLMDPTENMKAGIAHLQHLSEKYPGRPDLIAAAYNAGEGAVDKAGGIPNFSETQNYVRKVAAPSAPDRLDANGNPVQEGTNARMNFAVVNGKRVPVERSDTLSDLAIGAVKGVGNTVYGLGKLVHDYTPIGRISDAIQPGSFNAPPPELTPTNTAQKIGMTGEQIGEFFLPTGEAGALAKFINPPRFVRGAEALKAGLLSLAQGGTGGEASVSAALGGAFPGAGAVQRAGQSLKEGAEKTVVQALGPTKEWAKSEAAKLAPQMLERGVGGSRAAMLEKASANVGQIGQQIGAEVQRAAAAGSTVSGDKFVNMLGKARAALTDVNHVTGEMRTIPGHEASAKTLDKLIDFARGLGSDIPVEKAQTLKIAWDKIVDKAGLYGPKATSSATDNARAWAYREGASAFRSLIADGNATIGDLNKEFSFWKGLQKVLTATEARTQAQSGGLVAGIGSAAGAAAGFGSGQSWTDSFEKGAAGAFAGRQVVKLLQSPAWRTKVSAPLKNALADALMSGSAARINSATGRIVSSLPPQFRPALEP